MCQLKDMYLMPPNLVNPYSRCETLSAVESTHPLPFSNFYPYFKDGIIVQHDFLYYHYFHDRFNDIGWGCAYRVAQSILSWYKISPIPTILDMQQKLSDIGDKGKDFAGSSAWIGSFEIFLLIDTYCKDSLCKILPYDLHSNIPLKAKLNEHFTSEGGPIMIGDTGGHGGAICIAGIMNHTQNNNSTDDFEVLYLDPHYSGLDDVEFILDNGACRSLGPVQCLPHPYPNGLRVCLHFYCLNYSATGFILLNNQKLPGILNWKYGASHNVSSSNLDKPTYEESFDGVSCTLHLNNLFYACANIIGGLQGYFVFLMRKIHFSENFPRSLKCNTTNIMLLILLTNGKALVGQALKTYAISN
eukprot:gene5956-12020_t